MVEINDSVAMLRKKLEEAEDARSVLLQARKSLRQDIRFFLTKMMNKIMNKMMNKLVTKMINKKMNKMMTKMMNKMMTRVKETSLRIDEGKCLGQRLRFPYNQRCGRDCSFKYVIIQSTIIQL